MPKRKRTTKSFKRTYRRRKTGAKMVKAIVRRALKPHTQVIRKGTIIDSNLSGPFTAFHLNLINSQTNIFGTGANDQEHNQAKYVKLEMDCLIHANTENEPVTLACFIISLRNNVNDAKFNGLTGQIDLINQEDYYQTSGNVIMNPATVRVWRQWRMFFAARTSGENADTSLYRRKRVIIKPNFLVKNHRGDFGDLVCNQKPSGNLYLVVFNNNGSTDFENPVIRASIVNTYIA